MANFFQESYHRCPKCGGVKLIEQPLVTVSPGKDDDELMVSKNETRFICSNCGALALIVDNRVVLKNSPN